MYARHDNVPQSSLYADGDARSDVGWKKFREAMRLFRAAIAGTDSGFGAAPRVGLAKCMREKDNLAQSILFADGDTALCAPRLPDSGRRFRRRPPRRSREMHARKG
jgi:hypothetical protein